MKIHVGFDLTYESALSTPMIFMLNVHPSRAHDLITPDRLRITPSRAISPYIDGFGNKCVRILAHRTCPGILPRRLPGHGGAVVVAANDAAPT